MVTHKTQALRAGAAYFAIVFAAGFALGTVRVVLLAPRFGALTSVLLELPLMLTISWIACGWALTRFGVTEGIPARLTMGATALALLMVAEFLLSVAAFGRSMSEYLEDLATPHGLVGLAGQSLFALMPLVRKT